MTEWCTGNEGKRSVLILMGSQSDAPTVQHTCDLLRKLGITYDAYIASAHRTPDRVENIVANAEKHGFVVIIAAAGWAAALPGAASAFSLVLPVFGIAVEGRGDIDNLAAVLAIADLPPGIPAPLCGLGKGGAINAALAAAAVVGLVDPSVRERLYEYRRQESKKIPERPNFNPTQKN